MNELDSCVCVVSLWADHLAMNNNWKKQKHIDTVLVVNCDAADSDTHTTVARTDDDNAFCVVNIANEYWDLSVRIQET